MTDHVKNRHPTGPSGQAAPKDPGHATSVSPGLSADPESVLSKSSGKHQANPAPGTTEREYDRMLESLSQATRLLLYESDNTKSLPMALNILGAAFNAEQVSLFENRRDPVTNLRVFSQRHAWSSIQGMDAESPTPLHNMPYQPAFDALYEALSAGQTYSTRTEDLPEAMRRSMAERGVRFTTQVPVHIGQRLWGFLALDICTDECEWSRNERNILDIMAGVISCAIRHEETNKDIATRDRMLGGMAEAHHELLVNPDIEYAISRAIPILAASMNVDRFFIGENIHDPEQERVQLCMRYAHDQGSGRMETLPPETEPIDYDERLPGWLRVLEADQPISGALASLLPGQHGELRSILIAPLILNHQLWGVIGLERINVEHRWLKSELSALNAIATGIAAALSRKQTEHSLRNSEEQLRQSQKMEAVGRLAGGIAHDFNNLLTAILGYGELMLNQMPEGSTWASEVKEIYQAADRARALTGQLLAFSRRNVMEITRADMNEIILSSERLLSRLIGEDISLKVAPDASPCPVMVERTQIEQVILNLAINARDAMIEGGQLEITTERIALPDGLTRSNVEVPPGNYVRLSVADNGTGIPEEIQSHIFEPFFTTKDVGKGTGLGLAMVYGTVRQSNGYILFESEKNRGTVFSIYLPLAAPTQKGVQTSLAAPLQRGSEAVLLLEDDRMVRNVSERFLTARGYKVTTRDNGVQGLEYFREHSAEVDLVLTDITMPQMSGIAFADAARRIKPGQKILFMSGYADDKVPPDHYAKESRLFLQKPFSLNALCSRVREILDDTTAT